MKRISVAVLGLTSSLALAQGAVVRIDAARVENHISPRMYASFVEMMAEDVKWGMTAEMVHDRSFEEPANYLGLPAGWRLEPDERNDNVGAIRFEPTTEEAYPKTNKATGAAEHALRVTLARADITDERQGFSQGRISVRAGETYRGYVWVKAAPGEGGYRGEITVALEEDETDGVTYDRAMLGNVGSDWSKVEFTLKAPKTDRFAKLSFLFGGRGTLYLDEVSLEPAAARDQVRADSEAKIRELHPSFMRWPGGNVAQDYHWQWGVGPRDLRPTWVNKSWSNAPEPGDLGTDEYLALCARLGIEPSITVNVNGAGATPEEAAEWVEYVNGAATSKYGAMRAANGHAAPYNVKQWELGNEIFGGWVRGHVTGEQYGEAAVTYAKAMRAVDPSIRLIAVGEGVFPGSDAWNSAVLKGAGNVIDYLAVHDYTSLGENAKAPNPRAAMMARAGEFEANYRHLGELIRRNAPGREIKVIVNEWNLFYDAETIQSMEGAVYASRMMNGFERDGDIVEANSISDLLNGWVGGVIQASRDRVFGTAQFHALKMYADHVGSERLHAEVVSPKLQAGTEVIDAVASRTADGGKVFVKMSNADEHRAVSTKVDLSGFAHAPEVQVDLLAATESRQRNSFAHPDALKPQTKSLRCESACTIDLPADSVAVLTFRAR